jgi:outer membrane protein OmpA-like peptidoglycan-associated protein
MMVTAEPYAAVRNPSELVVLKNQIRPDTGGKTIEVRLQPELMDRGAYTWQVEAQPQAAPERKVSMSRYEALLELYQAQNAVALARAANAGQYATESFAAAQSALSEAQRLESSKGDPKAVIQNARQAEQAADDARTIAARKNTPAAPVAERAAAPREAAAPVSTGEASREAPASPISTSLHHQLDGSFLSRETPGGLVIILPDKSFDGSNLLTSVSEKLGPVASTLLSQPGVHVQVDGYTDSGELQSWERAQTVRNLLVGAGLSANQISIRGGAMAPASPDRRVQIVISGGQ